MQSCDSHILGAKRVAQVSGYPEMSWSVMMLENSQKENYKGKLDWETLGPMFWVSESIAAWNTSDDELLSSSDSQVLSLLTSGHNTVIA